MQDPSSLDAGLPHLLAVSNGHDEPERFYCDWPSGKAGQQALKNAAAASGFPFFTNYAGPWILQDVTSSCSIVPGDPLKDQTGDYCGIRLHNPNEWCYGEYFTQTNWISFDIYPRNQGLAWQAIKQVRDRIDVTPHDEKPRLAYIEASDYDCVGKAPGLPTSGRYPNHWHVTFEAVQAVIAGMRGIIYFPHGLGPSSGGKCGTVNAEPAWSPAGPDVTTPETQLEITRLNRVLASIAGTTMQGPAYEFQTDPFWFESGTTFQGTIKSGARADSLFAYFFTENDTDSTYSHVVRFRGVSNCLGKVVSVLNETTISTSPPVFQDRTVTLDASCNTTTQEAWQPRRYHIYRVPLL